MLVSFRSVFIVNDRLSKNRINTIHQEDTLPFHQGSKLLNFVRVTNIHSIRIDSSRTNGVSIGSTSSRICGWTGVINGAVISTANRQLKTMLWKLSYHSFTNKIQKLNDTYVTMYIDFIANMIWENKRLD